MQHNMTNFTEMLLFLIADREVFLDITKHFPADTSTSNQQLIDMPTVMIREYKKHY